MFLGLLLILGGSFFDELSNSTGKSQAMMGRESLFTFGFIRSIWALFILAGMTILGISAFTFDPQSIPTVLIRLCLEIILTGVVVKAIVTADRTTSTIFSSLTVPFLLIADIVFGYVDNFITVAAVALAIIGVLSVGLFDKKINKKGIGYVLFASLLAVVTTQLYKYNIQFNSVAAEQLISVGAVSSFYFAAGLIRQKYFLRSLFNRRLVAQSLSSGAGTVLFSFSIYYLPPSLMIAAKRVARMLWAQVSGRYYFHEHYARHKLAMASVAAVLVTFATYVAK